MQSPSRDFVMEYAPFFAGGVSLYWLWTRFVGQFKKTEGFEMITVPRGVIPGSFGHDVRDMQEVLLYDGGTTPYINS